MRDHDNNENGFLSDFMVCISSIDCIFIRHFNFGLFIHSFLFIERDSFHQWGTLKAFCEKASKYCTETHIHIKYRIESTWLDFSYSISCFGRRIYPNCVDNQNFQFSILCSVPNLFISCCCCCSNELIQIKLSSFKCQDCEGSPFVVVYSSMLFYK